MIEPTVPTPAGREPFRPRPLRVLAWAIAVGIVLSQWVRVITYPGGDFELHWKFGSRFLAGSFLYEGGMHIPYPPFWGMVNAPLSVVPMGWAHALAFPVGVAVLVGLTVLLDRLARPSLPLFGRARFWPTALALVLASRFLIRELPECGPNLIMVALAWAALACWTRGRDGWGGACLGLAIALKCTPALFVAYFAWKRQWRLVACATAFAALFTLAPVLRQGPTEYVHHMRTWIGNSGRGLGEADPSVGVLGQEEVKNVALRPILARYLVRLPAGHLGRIDSPWQVEGLGLSPATAGLAIKAAMLLLLASVAWTFRRPPSGRDDPTILWEAAAVSLLILLFSPITWRQHCVGVYPATYLIVRRAFVRRDLPRWLLAALTVYAFLVVGLDRGVIGRAWTLILDNFGVTTLSLLLLLAVTLACRSRAADVKAIPSMVAHHPSGINQRPGAVMVRRSPPSAGPWS